MNKEQAALFHIELWNNLAENVHWVKSNSPVIKASPNKYINDCPLCEYARRRFKKSSIIKCLPDWCSYCPLKHCSESYSLFNRWRYAPTQAEQKKLAIAIADAVYENGWIKL